MLLVDDILVFPFKGILWIFREIHNAAQEEMANEADRITLELKELYRMLESRQISEQEFDVREQELLDRLDRAGAREDAQTAPVKGEG